MTPKKKEQIINQVLRRARTASTPTNENRPKSPLRRNRFLSASISPSGRPPISPRSPISTTGSPFNNRALPVSSKNQNTPQNTPRKTPKKVANLDDSFLDRSSPPKRSPTSDKSSESQSRHSSLVKSPTKENSTQTPREIETQTDPDVQTVSIGTEPIVKTRIIKVPISPKPISRDQNTFDLNKIQKCVEEMTQQEILMPTPPASEVTKSTPTENVKTPSTNPISDKKAINSPSKVQIPDEDEKENIWNYFDKSIRVPNLDKTYFLGPDHIIADTTVVPEIDQEPDKREKRILNEVNESVYHGNETFVIGGDDSSKTESSQTESLNISNEKLVKMEPNKSVDSSGSESHQQSIDTSGCLFESLKQKEYSMNTIMEETETREISDVEPKKEEISPRDITPFPSSIINLASLQPPPFTSYKNEKDLPKPEIKTNPVDSNLINQINLESGQNQKIQGHLSEESEDDESAESFKLEFSFDPSQESFSSRINETIEPSASSTITSMISDSINLDEIDKMNPVELRKNLSKYEIKMPNLHNQKLIEKYRNELKDLTKKSRFGAIYSAELLKGFEVFPKRNDYQEVQQRLLDTNDISSKTRSASKKYYNYVLLDPRNILDFITSVLKGFEFPSFFSTGLRCHSIFHFLTDLFLFQWIQ